MLKLVYLPIRPRTKLRDRGTRTYTLHSLQSCAPQTRLPPTAHSPPPNTASPACQPPPPCHRKPASRLRCVFPINQSTTQNIRLPALICEASYTLHQILQPFAFSYGISRCTTRVLSLLVRAAHVRRYSDALIHFAPHLSTTSPLFARPDPCTCSARTMDHPEPPSSPARQCSVLPGHAGQRRDDWWTCAPSIRPSRACCILEPRCRHVHRTQ